MRRAPEIRLSPPERDELLNWANRRDAGDGVARRARIVLEAAGGRTNGEIARTLGLHPETVTRWRSRFASNRLEGLRRGAPRSRGPRRSTPSMVERVLGSTLGGHAPGGGPWTTRSLARHLKTNHMVVHRIWQAYGLATPPVRSLLPAAPTAPWVELVGVYLGPPSAVAVFCVEQRPLPDTGATHRRGSRTTRSAGRPRSDPLEHAIAEALEPVREAISPSQTPATRVHNLLVFLRGIERETSGRGQLSAVFDRPLDFLGERVGSWIRLRPRFRVYTPRPDEAWTSAIDGWIRRWEPLPLHPESFLSVPQFLTWVDRRSVDTPAAVFRGSWTYRSMPSDPPPAAPVVASPE